jgi:predicted peptidase
MKLLLVCICFTLFSFVLADAPTPFQSIPCDVPGNIGLVYEVQVGTEKIRVPFALFLPKNYEKDLARRWPMIFYLIGVGNQGTDLVGPTGVFEHGPNGEASRTPDMGQNLLFILCVPQTNRGWDATMIKAITQLVKILPESYRVDTDRVVVTGLSMGGTGTWPVLLEDPSIYAAAVPICGRPWKDPDEVAIKLLNCSVWNIVGGADDLAFVNGAKIMHGALQTRGVDTQLTMVSNIGHHVWMYYYKNPEFYHWVIRQVRPTKAMQTQAEVFRKVQNKENILITVP